MFGLAINEGTLANMLARTEAPLTAAAEQIATAVRQNLVAASDETSARVKGRSGWQWVLPSSTTRPGRKLARGIARCRGNLFVFLTRRDVPATQQRLRACTPLQRRLPQGHGLRPLRIARTARWGANLYAAAVPSSPQNACTARPPYK